jgi:pyruvate dehydrogenase E1 component
MMTYDTAFAYELAVIMQDGIKRMYQDLEDVFYYITVYNENYTHPAMPDNSHEGILNGMYCFKNASDSLLKEYKGKPMHLLGSGSLMQQVIEAQEILEKEGIPTFIWSVTSYNLLHRDFRSSKETKQKSYVETILEGHQGHFLSVSDWITLLPDSISRLFPGGLTTLGTDGYGLSETREALRDHFGVGAHAIVKKAKELLSQ